MLDKQDVNFLADQYVKYIDRRVYNRKYSREFNSVPGSDLNMAVLKNMDVDEYRKRRIEIESKLICEIQKLNKEHEKNIIEDATEFVLMMGELYLKTYKVSYLGILKDEITFTIDGSKAKVFKKEDSEANKLISALNLKKCLRTYDKKYWWIWLNDI